MTESNKEKAIDEWFDYLSFCSANQKKIDENINRFWEKLGDMTLGKIDEDEFLSDCHRQDDEENRLWKEWQKSH